MTDLTSGSQDEGRWQPNLSGALLRLSPLLPGDFEEVFAAAADPLLWQQHPQPNRYKKEVFLDYFTSALASKGALLIKEAKAGACIGCSRFYNPSADGVYIGYTFLTRAYWGGTWNKELKCLMISHAFQFTQKVYFEVGENNIRSQKALHRLGIWQVSKKGDHLVYEIDASRRKEFAI